MPILPQSSLYLLESVEHAHAALDTNKRVATVLGIHNEPIRMDSQAKYAALSREGGVYLRLPTGSGYQEKIWVRALYLILAIRSPVSYPPHV